jgi:hypothetical protein
MARYKSNPFMEEHDERNPFGPNYLYLDYDTKVNFKFSNMSRHIILREEDEKLKFNHGLVLVGSVPAALGWSYLLCWGICKLIEPLQFRYPLLAYRKSLICPALMAVSATLAYKYASDEYHQKVTVVLSEKYLQEAIKNGFKDYKISGGPG